MTGTHVRVGSRFIPVEDVPYLRPVPPIPVPVPVDVAPPADEHRPNYTAVPGPRPSCGLHIASWAVYTDPTGQPACKLCTSGRTRRAR